LSPTVCVSCAEMQTAARIDHARLLAWIREAYGLPAQPLTFLPVGFVVACSVLECGDGQRVFLKLWPALRGRAARAVAAPGQCGPGVPVGAGPGDGDGAGTGSAWPPSRCAETSFTFCGTGKPTLPCGGSTTAIGCQSSTPSCVGG